MFDVENIVDHSKRWVHDDRTRLYSDEKLEVREKIKNNVSHDNKCYQIEQFHACRTNPQNVQHEVLVQWRGLEEDEHSWEPLKNLFEDVLELVKIFLTRLKKHESAYAKDVEEFIRNLSSYHLNLLDFPGIFPRVFNAEFF